MFLQKFLFNIKNILPKQTLYLGRWNLKNKNRDLITLYSNEDHCGTCSQYSNTIIKPNTKTNQKNIKKDKNK